MRGQPSHRQFGAACAVMALAAVWGHPCKSWASTRIFVDAIGHYGCIDHRESLSPEAAISAFCGSPVDSAKASADTNCHLEASSTTENAGVAGAQGPVAGAYYQSLFSVEGNPTGATIPLVFRFKVRGSVELQTAAGDLASIAACTATFSATSSMSRQKWALSIACQAGQINVYIPTDASTSITGSAGLYLTPRLSIGPECPPEVPPLLEELLRKLMEEGDIPTSVEWPLATQPVTPVEALIAGAYTNMLNEILSEIPGVDVSLGFDVSLVYDMSVDVAVKVRQSDVIMADLVTTASASSSMAKARSEYTVSMEGVSVAPDYDAPTGDDLRVVLGPGLVVNVKKSKGRINAGRFAEIASHWKATDCGEENNWCDGTDINKDGRVDWRDLKPACHKWLAEVSPSQLLWEPGQGLYGGGSGTVEDPYLIYSAEQMNAIGSDPNYWDKHFRLMADIDLSGFDGRERRPAFNMIGRFTGDFDGTGHTISHLTINGGSTVGLFGQLDSGAEVRDLTVADVNVIGSGDQVGGLAGISRGNVTQCHSTGTVASTGRSVGGLVGVNQNGTVTDCHSAAVVRGASSVGGLVGGNQADTGRVIKGKVLRCYSDATVTGTGDYVGGLAGSNSGTVQDCSAAGSVSGRGSLGGLVGGNNGTGAVTSSNSGATVTGTGSSTGGLAGYNWGTIQDCNATGKVSGVNTVGGLVGGNQIDTTRGTKGKVLRCYSGATVTGTGDYVGGLAGSNSGTVQDCNAAGSVSGQGKVGGLVGGNNDTGAVTSSNSRATVAGTGDWTGGLVGFNWGTIQNCDARGEVSGVGGFGGLAGGSSGTVTRCHAASGVSGGDRAGGLSGVNFGTLTECSADGAVSGGYATGGLVGENQGAVRDSYSVSGVSGSDWVGGLLGVNFGGSGASVARCFAAGRVAAVAENSAGGLIGGDDGKGSVTSCFWDTQATGQATSPKGTGKTTAQMRQQTSFTGWDFSSIWTICRDKDYPRLKWEQIACTY